MEKLEMSVFVFFLSIKCYTEFLFVVVYQPKITGQGSIKTRRSLSSLGFILCHKGKNKERKKKMHLNSKVLHIGKECFLFVLFFVKHWNSYRKYFFFSYPS